jgi:hypothetical protein
MLVDSLSGRINFSLFPGRELYCTLHAKFNGSIVNLLSKIEKVFVLLDPDFQPDTDELKREFGNFVIISLLVTGKGKVQ